MEGTASSSGNSSPPKKNTSPENDKPITEMIFPDTHDCSRSQSKSLGENNVPFSPPHPCLHSHRPYTSSCFATNSTASTSTSTTHSLPIQISIRIPRVSSVESFEVESAKKHIEKKGKYHFGEDVYRIDVPKKKNLQSKRLRNIRV